MGICLETIQKDSNDIAYCWIFLDLGWSKVHMAQSPERSAAASIDLPIESNYTLIKLNWVYDWLLLHPDDVGFKPCIHGEQLGKHAGVEPLANMFAHEWVLLTWSLNI